MSLTNAMEINTVSKNPKTVGCSAQDELINPLDDETIAWALSTQTVRAQAHKIYELALNGETNFSVNLERLSETIDYVIEVTDELYPDLQIPDYSRWRHFSAGGVDRSHRLFENLSQVSKEEKTKASLDLTVVSVLLDAGAGSKWRFIEGDEIYSRSEGLAVASFNMFAQGLFSSIPDEDPLRVDAKRLQEITVEQIAQGFQVTPENPMNGLEGRALLLRKLGHCLEKNSTVFGDCNPRPGNLLDHLRNIQATRPVKAVDVLSALQTGIGEIWPGRIHLKGFNIGDAWQYLPLGSNIDGVVPFHKLSQWMTYSLLEPLKLGGLKTVDNDALTGLAEYRNGGLLLNMGLINLRDPAQATQVHPPGSELIVEWRALTVHLMDQIALGMRSKLGKSASELPLQSVWEGGTWWAGRKLDFKLNNGLAALSLRSDGTVF